MLLSTFPQKSRHTESEKLQVQIQAYLDNVFDVGGLLEDAETKNVALEKVEELEEHVSHVSVLCLPAPVWRAERTGTAGSRGPAPVWRADRMGTARSRGPGAALPASRLSRRKP